MYEDHPHEPSVLVNTVTKVLEKIRWRGDLSGNTLNYFLIEHRKFARFYLLHNVPGRPVISN